MKLHLLISAAAALCLAGCSNETSTPTPPPVHPVQPTNSAATNAAATNATATDSATNASVAAPAAPPADGGAMTTTASGLKYLVLKHGTGAVSPKATDTVRVHYHGTLLNGTVFDSSVQRGEPISFPLNRVIPGWTEGVQLMKVGDKFKFEIPANLAYGAASRSPLIPPHSTLVFEVELLAIE